MCVLDVTASLLGSNVLKLSTTVPKDRAQEAAVPCTAEKDLAVVEPAFGTGREHTASTTPTVNMMAQAD